MEHSNNFSNPRGADRPLRIVFVANSKKELSATLPSASNLSAMLRGEFVVLGMFSEEMQPGHENVCTAHALQHHHTLVSEGDPLSVLANVVSGGRFDMVIVPSMDGSDVTKMVHRLQVPVLVVRHGTPKTILAAVGLRDQLSVFGRAAQLSNRLGASLLLVHHIAPRPWLQEEEVSDRRARLQALFKVAPRAKIVTLHEDELTTALLSYASVQRQPLLVVGARPHWYDRDDSFDVSSYLIDKSSCDILVAPLAS